MTLPSGTVTFLFTDIEGSTRLLHELGDEYAAALAEHRRVLREAFTRHGGVEVDTQGDAFFVAFAKASDAVAAAADARGGLEHGPIRVRIGLHTGEPLLTDEGYVGIDVHRAARIAAAGHGGQILLSQATRELVAGAELVDLGEHHLKDLAAPERIYQVGAGDFAPLKSLHRTNLPQLPEPLVGRKKELADLLRALRGDARLVTVTGPGGVGKTRFALDLAAQLSDRFADGVWWVGLAPVRDATLVPQSISAVLGVGTELAAELRDKSLLLLLDNFEHVVDAAADLADLQRACPGVVLLVTSRESLHIAGERVYPLQPLPESPAVELFRQRAEAVAPDFEADYATLSELCDRLDGLPLAIELAAARTQMLSAAELLARLDKRLPLLTSRRRDVDERQRTLKATIEWSYELLDAQERELFAALAVFPGGFDATAADAVCGAGLDELESLVDKSLLRHTEEARFFLLATVREHALERLDASGMADAVRRRHAGHYAEVARATNLAVDSQGEMRHDLALLDAGNFRAALAWCVESGERELGLELAVGLENFWATQDPREGMHWFEALLSGADEIAPTLRARALRSMGSAASVLSEHELGRQLYEQSLALSRSAGDGYSVAHMLVRLAVEARRDRDHETARALADESLALSREFGHRKAEAQALTVLAFEEWRDGNRDLALELASRGYELSIETGFVWWQCIVAGTISEWALEAGDVEGAERHAQEALRLAHGMNDRLHVVEGLAVLAWVAVRRRRAAHAGLLWGAVEAEEEHGGLGLWEAVRAEYAAEMPADDDAFRQAVIAGRELPLAVAVEAALGSVD